MHASIRNRTHGSIDLYGCLITALRNTGLTWSRNRTVCNKPLCMGPPVCDAMEDAWTSLSHSEQSWTMSHVSSAVLKKVSRSATRSLFPRHMRRYTRPTLFPYMCIYIYSIPICIYSPLSTSLPFWYLPSGFQYC